MPNLEIEYDEATGKIGTLPEPVQKFVDSLINERNSATRKKIETEFAERYKPGTPQPDPVQVEKLKTLEDENARFKIEDAERRKQYDEAEKLRTEREDLRLKDHQKILETHQQEITRRDGRLRDMARSEIKIAAKNLGARTESLDELAALLGADLDLDADLTPFVKGTDSKPAVDKDGKPVTIEGHVKAYLDTHAHHRAPVGGTGGGARGGATLTHLSGPERDAQDRVNKAQEALSANPRSNAAISGLLEAERHLRKVTQGK